MNEALSITMPQAIILNHAAWVNRRNSDKRHEAKREREQGKKSRVISTPLEQAEADRVNSLSKEELSHYMRTGWE